MLKNSRLFLVACMVTCLSSAAMADDLVPPPWLRGMPLTTAQEWDFMTPSLPLPPDGSEVPLFNPNGTPLLAATPGSTWLPAFAGRTGVYELGPGGGLVFGIPNVQVPTNVKEMWIQVTYWGAMGSPSVFVPGLPPIVPITHSVIPLPGGWTHWTGKLSIFPQPNFEEFHFFNNTPTGGVICVDQVVIDTRCRPVPEPATMAGLGVGIATLVVRRRRKA